MTFTPRLEAPTSDNLYYIKTTHGGYNKCIVINPETGQVMPNCTGYAYGRFMEEQGITSCNLSTGNAANWYLHSDGYTRGQTPRLGAIICYRGGTDNLGHVAVVEEIHADGSLTISESAYNSFFFRTKTVSLPRYYWGNLYEFQGFLYPPSDFGGFSKKRFPWVLYSRKLREKRNLK